MNDKKKKQNNLRYSAQGSACNPENPENRVNDEE